MKKDINGWSTELSQQRLEQGQASGEWLNKTIAQMATEIAADEPQRITHVFEGQPCTVSDLLQEARLLAGALQRRGLVSGDAISFQLPNWREAAVVDLAASLLGLVIVPIVSIYRDAEVSFMLADARVKAAFFPQQYRGFDYAEMMQRLRADLPQLQLLCCVRGEQQQALDYAALIAEAEPAVSLPEVDANGVKLVLYTSGTTGRPKAVLHSHNTGPLRLKRGFEHWTQGQGGTLLMASPVTHVTGLSGLELPFYLSSRTVFMDRWDAREALEIIDREQVTVSLGATPFLHELLTQAEQHGRRLPSLQAFACGGAEVPPALIYRAAEVFERCRAFRVFGSSEVPLVTLGFVGADQLELAATTDGEVHGYQVKVVDDDGREVALGAEGELMIKGAAMFLGYADMEQNASSFDVEGYFATGDLGRLTSDNAIVITGRKKDLINRGGEKISAKEVEDILHQLPQVHEAAVVSMPHMRLGETLCAYVILRDGQQLSLQQMIQMVSDTGVARQKIPERLVALDDFPRTASGKVRKDQLRADIRARIEQQTAVAQ